jgi:predicted transcriptional regulator
MVYSVVNALTSVKNMENTTEMATLFFEFASESRLDILCELSLRNWKMNDLARKLALTTTETFRQLTRLNESLLIKKQPDATYAITAYGKLVIQLLAPAEFVFKHQQYFLTHDAQRLPAQFISRLNELHKTQLRMGMVESTMRTSQMIGNAKRFMWAMSAESPPQPLDWIAKQVPNGAEYRLLSPLAPLKLARLENRTFVDPPVVVALTEQEAAVCFRFLDGRVDYAGFFGADPAFLGWARDLFLYYWDKGART